MVELLGWSAAVLAGLMLLALLWGRIRKTEWGSSQGNSFLIVLSLAILVNSVPHLLGASDSVRIIGSMTGMFLVGFAVALLVRGRLAQ